MSKIVLIIRTDKRHIILGGFVFYWKVPDLVYFRRGRNTTIGLIPPQPNKEGQKLKLWGYDKYTQEDES